MDIAQEDTWAPRNNEVHTALAARGIPHTWQVNQGVHDYTYWMKHALDYLRFYAGSVTH
jgi:putative tributyrin esterase